MQFMQDYWSWLAVAVIVYMIGEGTKRLFSLAVPDSTPEPKWPMWYRIWHLTLPLHPVTGAALFGLIPLPVPHFVPGIASKMIYFGVAGAVCGQVYEMLKRAIAGLKLFAGRSSAPPPAQAAQDSEQNEEQNRPGGGDHP